MKKRSSDDNAAENQKELPNGTSDGEYNTPPSRPQRERCQPDRYSDWINGSIVDRMLEEDDDEMTIFALNAMTFVDDVPRSFRNIEGREDAAEWGKAVNGVIDEKSSMVRLLRDVQLLVRNGSSVARSGKNGDCSIIVGDCSSARS